MYLYWMKNSLGSISLSRAGLIDFVNSLLMTPYKCTQVSLSASEGMAYLVIGLPKESNSLEMDMVETRLKESLGRVGLQVRISWAETERTHYDGPSGLYAFIRKPIVWALWASGCAVLILDGLGTLLWTLLWGGIFYWGAEFLQSDKGSRLLKKIRGTAGR